MTWDRTKVADALVSMLGAATGVKVHERPPETLNPLCVVVGRPQPVAYAVAALGIDDATLSAALAAYQANGNPVQWRARPYSSRAPTAANPWISGYAIPQPFDQIVGDAGATAEVAIDWNLTGPPSVDTGTVAAATATAGAPGYYSPSGAQAPANLAALTGVTASPTAAWATGQYVITGDLLANHWTGSAWAAGKA